MTSEHKPHPEHLPIYYGIHDALRELGDVDADVGDTAAPSREGVISGLWDADSALSRLFKQHAALEHRCEMLQQELERVSRTLMRTAGATGV